MKSNNFARILSFVAMLSFAHLIHMTSARAEQIRIVALGASDLNGRYLQGSSWAVQLERMLRAKGYDVSISVNAVAGITSAGVLSMVDAVPRGTRVVVFSNGGSNDIAKGIPRSTLVSNTGAIMRGIRARGAVPIRVNPTTLPGQYRQADNLHLTAQGNAVLASHVLPQVIAALGKSR